MLSNERKNYLTASDIGAVLGYSEFKTRSNVLKNKVNARLGLEEEQIDNPALRHGRDNEHRGVAYANDLHQFVKTGDNQVFATKGFLGATVDGSTIDGELLLEIKCPFKKIYRANEIELLMPDNYCQIQFQMYVTGAKRCLFVVVSPDGITTHCYYDYDINYVMDRMGELESFWQTVQDSCDYAESGDNIDLEMSELHRQIKELEAELDALKDALTTDYPNGGLFGRVTVTNEKRAGSVDIKKLEKEFGFNSELYRKAPTTFKKVSIK